MSNPPPGSEREPTHGRVYVLFGVVYLIITLVWFWLAPANAPTDPSKFDASMRKFIEFFAIVAAPLWFLSTFTQAESFRARIVALSVGIVVLLPLPLVVGVTPL